jgi:glyoxylase-like metal-dependent hydrolase (beta-lactamase superfamily II)
MRIQTFTGGAFDENSFLVSAGDDGRAVVIDPGAAAYFLLERVEEEGLEVEAILVTHAHLDHIEGLDDVRQATGAPIYLHPDDRPLYEALEAQAQVYGFEVPIPPPPDRDLTHGQELHLGGCTFQVRFTPGHAPGHVVFYAENAGVAFVGDVIFAGSIGRTDLPGGDYQELMGSIRDQILTLPEETRLLSGHGPETTVGLERMRNPFLVSHFGGGFA